MANLGRLSNWQRWILLSLVASSASCAHSDSSKSGPFAGATPSASQEQPIGPSSQGTSPEPIVTRDDVPAQFAPPAPPPGSMPAPDPAKEKRAAAGGLASPGAGLGRGSAASVAVKPSAKMAAAASGVATEMAMSPSEFNTEAYSPIVENAFHESAREPLSTFSIDVDTASYSNVRRFLNQGALPPKDSVRIEELINYFSYTYPNPTAGEPFSINTEVTECPWESSHALVHVGLQAKNVMQSNMPPRNLVFLVDVSGSMNGPDRLPLVKKSLDMLVDELRPVDRVSIVVYAGASGLALAPTSGADKSTMRAAIAHLEAGGSTNGGQGVRLAYDVARANFQKGGINRVILATDGDFNVGTTSQGELVSLIEQERKSGVFLTVLGYGKGNVKDSTMELLADKGNGNYAYIDSLREARKVLVEQAGATLMTVAKDVKIQVEFNPRLVQSYRLIGYENRKLEHRDFNDDKKDAGEIGAGHSVTALYEVVPAGASSVTAGLAPSVDALTYQGPSPLTARASGGEWLTLKLRYKETNGEVSKLLSRAVSGLPTPLAGASDNARFASAVAAFGMTLRNSEQAKGTSMALVRHLAEGALGNDPRGYRAEFVELVGKAERLIKPTARIAGN